MTKSKLVDRRVNPEQMEPNMEVQIDCKISYGGQQRSIRTIEGHFFEFLEFSKKLRIVQYLWLLDRQPTFCRMQVVEYRFGRMSRWKTPHHLSKVEKVTYMIESLRSEVSMRGGTDDS